MTSISWLSRFTLVVLSPALAGQSLVKDFNTQPDPTIFSSEPGRSNGLWGEAFGGVLFTATTRGAGQELWWTDGTAANTRLLHDLQPGPRSSLPRSFARLASGDVCFLALVDGLGAELWLTDGTPNGARLVTEIRPGPESAGAFGLTAAGSQLFFFADDGVNGSELWTSDGTAAGTRMVVDIQLLGGITNGSNEIASVGNRVLFNVLTGSTAGRHWELWTSDGTAVGTNMILALPPRSVNPPRPERFRTFGSQVLFTIDSAAGPELWVSDGSSLGTINLGAVAETVPILVTPGVAYFARGSELWSTDGTLAGTVFVASVASGPFASTPRPHTVLPSGEVMFTASVGPFTSLDLYRTDAASGVPVQIVPVDSVPFHGEWFGPYWMFVSRDSAGFELWRTDGTTAGTLRVKDINPGPEGSSPRDFTSVNGQLLFSADDGAHGRELWASDGTTNGTALLRDLATGPVSLGSNATPVGSFDGYAYIRAFDGVSPGSGLWKSDGTTAGTVPFVPGAIYPDEFVFGSDFFFFFANTPGQGLEPWRSDGTAAGTWMLSDINPGAASSIAYSGGVEIGRRIFFGARDAANVQGLWVTDGTSAGTALVAAPSVSGVIPRSLFAWQGRLYYSARLSSTGFELFVSDGTAGGTHLLADVFPGQGDSFATPLAAMGGHLYFSAFDDVAGGELWRTDGTAAGTARVVDLAPGPASSSVNNVVTLGNKLLFAATDGSRRAVWESDGTAVGTQLLWSSATERPLLICALGNGEVLFATVDDLGNDLKVWQTDGTQAGTALVRSIDPNGVADQRDYADWVGESRYVFVADDGLSGAEPWVSDLTSAGTRRLVDLSIESSIARDFVRVGNRLLFSADDGFTGRELHGIDLSSIDDYVAESYGLGCVGTNGVAPTLDVVGVPRATSGPFQVAVDNALPNANGAYLFSGRDPIRVPLGRCRLLVDAPVAIPFVTGSTGGAAISLQMSAGLVGAPVRFQSAVVDPAGGFLGVAFSAGLEVIGAM